MYIYLDESYNLKDKNKKQFISINGFSVLDERALFKKWKEYRAPFAGKRRIHAADSAFDSLRVKTLKLFAKPDVTLLTVFQVIQEIPFDREKGYFKKGKLNFENVYSDLIKTLFKELHLEEYAKVKIIIDSRKTKGGILAKKRIQQDALLFLGRARIKPSVEFRIQPSSTDILLEFADFVSNIFYREYQNGNDVFFEEIDFKLVQIKNPL